MRPVGPAADPLSGVEPLVEEPPSRVWQAFLLFHDRGILTLRG
jgi:hypothetical protein